MDDGPRPWRFTNAPTLFCAAPGDPGEPTEMLDLHILERGFSAFVLSPGKGGSEWKG